ncbi:pPIWI_RE_Z domain-containing protein [Streptomyces hydrogenans]|uniref:pPIWI_RE_Z domain-containing protein n=1 Tax=Streptomyces hydrogenans TaxID=1873719 RepID=UPI0035DED8A8
MRDQRSWHRSVSQVLHPALLAQPGVPRGFTATHLCQVELGLRLLERLDARQPAEGAYTLFGGYPFARVAGLSGAQDAGPGGTAMLAAARHLLWPLRRGHAWRQALETYRLLPAHLRAYEVPPADLGAPPVPLLPVVVPGRIDAYDRALSGLPEFVRRPLPLAPAGRSSFRELRRASSVTIPADLVFDRPRGHDLTADRAGRSAPITITRRDLSATARWMDETERREAVAHPGDWERRLAELRLAPRDADGRGFTDSDDMRVDGLFHLVGMVGAGKSTLMTLLAVWAARLPVPLRTTLVVGDVAEQLRLCGLFAALGLNAVPLLGGSTRETHVQRMHRRLASRGLDNLLDHDDPGFDALSTVCLVSGLRGTDHAEPLRYADAPCTALEPESQPDEDDRVPADPLEALRTGVATTAPRNPGRLPEDDQNGTPHGCPVWAECPRHATARAQVDAPIWVANPASLVQSPVPSHLNDERLRQLELASLRSDIIVVDEADSVQMRLDQLFAPTATLVQPGLESSWLDQLNTHKIEELCRNARLPLTDRQVHLWNKALASVTTAVDPLCRQLIEEEDLREWIDMEYFSPWTLQQQLLDEWFRADFEQSGSGKAEEDETHLYEGYDDDGGDPDLGIVEPLAPDPRRAAVAAVLDAFRDDPFGDREPGPEAPLVGKLVRVAQDLLHSQSLTRTNTRLREAAEELLSGTPCKDRVPDGSANEPWWDTICRRLGFTLLLSALHQRLDRLTFLWPQVEAALRLDAAGKELARRTPLDYAPIVPESPMGNVLGFQYLPDDQDRDEIGRTGGTLRFFRCTGVGRELLLRLHELGADPATGRGGPHVILMSGTSWAGESTRAHVLAPVAAVLKPSEESLEAVARTRFGTHFLYDDNGRPMSLSGTRLKDRIAQARAMAARLARPGLSGSASPLDQELAKVGDDHRRRALLLVGSYREAYAVADTLDGEERWHGRVKVLVPDDADPDEALHGTGLAGHKDGSRSPEATLRRGDLARFADDPAAEVLVAPLLAVERGHNILNSHSKAAFGTALFLVRPHPRPDDLSLSIFAVNDWITRFARDIPRDDRRTGPATFTELVTKASSLDEAGQSLRHEGREEWRRLLSRRYVYSHLADWEKRAFAWDQLVTMWQVIGRLVRGGVPARVVFVDAAFAPSLAKALSPRSGTQAVPRADGLLQALGTILTPYFTDSAAVDPADAQLARLLYEPFHTALSSLESHSRPTAA